MKNTYLALPLLLALLATGCTGLHRNGTAHVDEFDNVQVAQMTGNEIDPQILSRSVLCLNARRETRRVTAVTNLSVNTVTNVTVTPITNVTVASATNYQYTVMTNLTPATPTPTLAASGETPATPGVGAAPPPVEVTNSVAAPAPAQQSTNLTLSLANNASATHSPSQSTANQQSVRSYNQQLTTSSNNLTISLLTNRVVTSETNIVVAWVTNTAVASVTNLTLVPTNYTVADYFLVSELIPPPDFTLAAGESLILLVDGVRHGFAPGQSGTAFVGRRGFNSSLYRVPPSLLVDIANAKEVRVRFKGANNTLERTLSAKSQKHFRQFLLRHFAPPAGEGPAGGA